MRRVLLGALALGWAGLAGAAVLGQPGLAGQWRLADSGAARPDYERENRLTVDRVAIVLGPEAEGGQWVQLTFSRLNGEPYQIWLLLDGYPSLDRVPDGQGVPQGRAPRVKRYLLQQPGWPDAVEFVHEVTGATQMPRHDFWCYGWPQSSTGGPLRDLAAAQIVFLGYEFTADRPSAPPFAMPEVVTRVPINPDLIIGMTFTWRDTEFRHRIALGKEQYDYVRPSLADVLADHRAGINLHEAEDWHPELERMGIYSNRLHWPPTDYPAELYRPNCWPRSIYVDEPAAHYRGAKNAANAPDPELTLENAARGLEAQSVANMWLEGDAMYSVLRNQYMIGTRFGLGKMKLIEQGNVQWEAFWPCTWYELARPDSPSGLVDEDGNHEQLVESYNMAFGIFIPATVANACKLRVAVGRGAARNFGKSWGVAIYSFNLSEIRDPKIDAAAWEYYYRAGANYFWFWNCWPGLSDAHVPYSYKRFFADAVRQAFREHPDRDMEALKRAATTCIVLPYGYTFAPWPLLWLKQFHLDKRNETGKSYREILSNAAVEVERCIRNGIEFDLAVDEPRFHPDGYRELVYIRADGTVEVKRPDGTEKLAGPRMPERPDLGELSQFSLKIRELPLQLPGRVTLEAVLDRHGAGELAMNHYGDILTAWELVRPDDYVETVYYDSPGLTRSFDLTQPGKYSVRFAAADCFGRPSIATLDFEVK